MHQVQSAANLHVREVPSHASKPVATAAGATQLEHETAGVTHTDMWLAAIWLSVYASSANTMSDCMLQATWCGADLVGS